MLLVGQFMEINRGAAGVVPLSDLVLNQGASGRFSVSVSLYLADQLALLIGRMHEQGRVHGSLAPSCILLAADGAVTLAGSDGVFRPATAYLAPEIRNGEAPDVLSDVYAICAIVYELLTGMTVLQAFVRAPQRELTQTPLPSLFNPGVDGTIDDLVTGAVARDPAARPHSVRALRDAIGRCFRELDLQPSPGELAAMVHPLIARPVIHEPRPAAPKPAPRASAPVAVAAPAPVSPPRRVIHQPRWDLEVEASGSYDSYRPPTRSPMRTGLGVLASAAILLLAVIAAQLVGPAPKRSVSIDDPVVSAGRVRAAFAPAKADQRR
jgi:hypothetical protein